MPADSYRTSAQPPRPRGSAAPVIRHDHQTLLREFLRQADMVKFAEFIPVAEDVGSAVEAAKRFIRQTVPDEPLAGQGKKG